VLELAGVGSPPYLDGQPFLGDGPGVAEREYAFAARDRMDESYSMSRAVRTDRFKYIRNYYPENPRLLWIPYRAQGPAMQDVLGRYREGDLSGPSADLCGRGPPEELYEVRDDPDEIHNLANDPEYHDGLNELRSAIDDWRVHERSDRLVYECPDCGTAVSVRGPRAET
jgi:arylsulfatase A-like enzyme